MIASTQRVGLMLLLALALAVACAPRSPIGQSGDSSPARAAPAAPKTLVIAVQAEPKGLNPYLTPGLTAGGSAQMYLIAHNYLVVSTDQGTRRPQLAERLISTEDGSWRLNPEGTMDTTWRLRPNTKWQDDAPFTADDLVFTFTVYKDPAIPGNPSTVLGSSASALNAMESVQALDPLTFEVHWSLPNANADLAPNLIPVPHHLLADAYDNDRANFINSPVFGPQFIGLGPYRLTNWEPGVQLEFARFDDYFLGRPPIDRVTARFIRDPTAMVASILAGTIDVILPHSVDVELAQEIKQRWEGTGNQVVISPAGSMNYIQFQHRPQYARPANGFTNTLVRQAFYHATDRQAVTDIVTSGVSPVADNWFPPTDAMYPQVKSAIPQYPHDLALAQQRLAEAGWLRNAEGDLISQATGARFEVELWGAANNFSDKLLPAVANPWQTVGAQVAINVIPATRSGDAEYRNTFPGAQVTGSLTDQFFTSVLDSRQVAGPQNRWTGANRSGYRNPALDALYDQLQVTIDPAARIELHRAVLQMVLGDVALMPLHWTYAPVLALKGVHGVGGMVGNTNTWNVFEWTKD